MRAALLAILPGAFAVLTGCNGERGPDPTVGAFDAKAAEFIKKEGKATITGHAFLRRSNGVVVNAAGETVRLVPVTPYSQARFVKLYNGQTFIAAGSIPKVDPDPLYASYTRTTKAESSGKFEFDKVGPGTYYVATQLTWNDQAIKPEGGAMFETVTITGKETEPVKIILSGK